jgi:hypothetical protein
MYIHGILETGQVRHVSHSQGVETLLHD